MTLSAKSIWTMSLAALVCASSAVHVAAEDRCTGTLCDLYYGSGGGEAKPQPATGQAGPTPITVPTGGVLGFLAPRPVPAANQPSTTPLYAPRVAIEGGGLVGKLNGAQEQRCTGTLCDLFYGGPPPERPAPTTASLAPNPSTHLAPAEAPPKPGLASAEWPETAAVRYRESRDVERETKPRCVAPASDPWRCYR